MPLWLLEADLCDRFQSSVEAGIVPTATQQAAYEGEMLAANANGPRILSTKGAKATVDVQGILTDAPDFMAKLFGGGNTTYMEIQNSIAAANADPEVDTIEMSVSSPGGQASAEWLAAMDAVANSKKPIKAVVGTMAASAAYGIVSQADQVVAKNAMSMFGSVGVMTSRYVGTGKVNITSTNAPNKNPDVATPEGKAALVAELDDIHNIFAATVAKGRKTTAENVNTKFGKGGIVLAADAVARGMIDGLAENVQHPVKQTSIAAKTGTEGAITMDKTELKTKHPEVYAAILAEGVTQGTTAERDRVVGHLTMGEGLNAMSTALAAIKDGSGMTATITSQYMVAGANREDSKARKTEDEQAAAALAAAAAGKGAPAADAAAADALANAVAEDLGLEV